MRATIVVLIVVGVASAAAQRGQSPSIKLQAGDTDVGVECLSKEELDLNRSLQALTRSTRGVEAAADADDALRFNPHYFVGRWTIDGVLPESPLGPAGELTGVDTIRYIGNCVYESTLQAKG